MIRAKAISCDETQKAEFDATPYFERATVAQIQAMRAVEFCYDPSVEKVAIFIAGRNPEVAKVLHSRNGFECWISAEDAEAWLQIHEGEAYV